MLQKFFLLTLLIFGFGLGGFVLGTAEAKPKKMAKETEAFLEHCGPEIQKYCGNIPVGFRQNCIRKNWKKASPACKSAMDASGKKAVADIKKWDEACRGDIQKFCKGVFPGGGRQKACLKGARNAGGTLSNACNTLLK